MNAFALVHKSDTSVTMPSRMGLFTTTSAQWMTIIQLPILTSARFLRPTFFVRTTRRAILLSRTHISRSFVHPNYISIIDHSISDLAPINCFCITQICKVKIFLEIIIIKKYYDLTMKCFNNRRVKTFYLKTFL